eukprot:jgi/Chlat1/870/Chrsp107S01317
MPTGTLDVTVLSANGLKNTETFGRMDPYAILRLDRTTFRTRTATDMGTRPVWNEKFSFKVLEGFHEVYVEIFNANVLADDSLGTSSIPLSRTFAAGQDTLQVPVYRKNKGAGELSVTMQFRAQTSGIPAPAGQSTPYPTNNTTPQGFPAQGYTQPPQQAYPGYPPLPPNPQAPAGFPPAPPAAAGAAASPYPPQQGPGAPAPLYPPQPASLPTGAVKPSKDSAGSSGMPAAAAAASPYPPQPQGGYGYPAPYPPQGPQYGAPAAGQQQQQGYPSMPGPGTYAQPPPGAGSYPPNPAYPPQAPAQDGKVKADKASHGTAQGGYPVQGYPPAPGYGAPPPGYGAPSQGYGAPSPQAYGAPGYSYPQGYPPAPGYAPAGYGAPAYGQPGYGTPAGYPPPAGYPAGGYGPTVVVPAGHASSSHGGDKHKDKHKYKHKSKGGFGAGSLLAAGIGGLLLGEILD